MMTQRKLLSPEERQALLGIPDDEASLIRHYTLSPQDRLQAEVRRRSHNQLGYAVQLCLMRYPGRIHGVEETAPAAMVAYHLEERIDAVTGEIEDVAAADEACQCLMSVPGVGPIIASAMVAAFGNGAAFRQGCDFRAWLGLVPRQNSTGGRTVLGRLSKLPALAPGSGRSRAAALAGQVAPAQLWRMADWRFKAPAPQRAGGSFGQQAGAHCLECAEPEPGLYTPNGGCRRLGRAGA
jgi:hypothetical protein